MTADNQGKDTDQGFVVDADFIENLDALGRDIDHVEALARAALAETSRPRNGEAPIAGANWPHLRRDHRTQSRAPRG